MKSFYRRTGVARLLGGEAVHTPLFSEDIGASRTVATPTPSHGPLELPAPQRLHATRLVPPLRIEPGQSFTIVFDENGIAVMSEPAGFEATVQEGSDALLLWFRANPQVRWRQGAYETESGQKAASLVAGLIEDGRLVEHHHNDGTVSYVAAPSAA